MKKRSVILLSAVGIAAIAAGGLAAVGGRDDACNRLAGSPLEPGNRGAGVEFTKIDHANAIPACEAALRAEPESAAIHFRLGRALLAGGREADALKHYKIAATKGNAVAARNAGLVYRYGQTIPRDPAQAVMWFRRGADAGDSGAQVQMGDAYKMALGVPRDFAEAARWYRMAADQQDANGMFFLGELYDNGWGVRRDLIEAFKLYLAAAKLGHPSAQQNVATMYAKGEGVAINQQEATRWFKAASNNGMKDARRTMAFRYYKDAGPERNVPLAVNLLTSLHKDGDLMSSFALGLIYLEYFRDMDQAERLFRMAAGSTDPVVRRDAGIVLAEIERSRSGSLTAGQVVVGLIGLGIGLAILAGPSSSGSSSSAEVKTWTPPDAFSPENIGATMLWLE